MARFNWLQGWRAHALMRLIRCLGEQTHRTQNTRELADALRWTMAAVRAAACVESDGAELVPVVEECDGQGLIKAPVGTQVQFADAQELMLSAMALRYPARGAIHLISIAPAPTLYGLSAQPHVYQFLSLHTTNAARFSTVPVLMTRLYTNHNGQRSFRVAEIKPSLPE
jgi:hypothetical protein